MKYTKQELINSIRSMQEIVDDHSNAESIRNSIKPSLAEAKKLLAELEAVKPAGPAKKRTVDQIVKSTKAGKKNEHTPAAEVPMTTTQKKTLQQIVANSKKYAAYRGKSEEQLRRDAARSAKKPGKRTSAGEKKYREYRTNRTDVTSGEPHLAKGGQTKKKAQNIYIAKTSNEAFGIKKGDAIKVYKTYFRNGENHFQGIMNGKSVDVPTVFFEGNPTDSFADGGTIPENKRVAHEILNQLGGRGRLSTMTGANNFVSTENSVSFRIKNPKANYVKIVLNSMDTYDVEIGRVRGDKYTVVQKDTGIYDDMLKKTVEKGTGMYLTLFKKGGFVSEHNVGDSVVIKDKYGRFTINTEITHKFQQDGVWLYTAGGGTYTADEMLPNNFAKGGKVKKVTYDIIATNDNDKNDSFYIDYDFDNKMDATTRINNEKRAGKYNGYTLSIVESGDQDDFAKGGAIAANQMEVYGYKTTTFTPAAKTAFENAITELEKDKYSEGVYYSIAKEAMKVLAQNVNTLLKPGNLDGGRFTVAMLQSVGINNYKTGLLLDTSFLNKELAERKLSQGGGFNQYGEPYGFDDDGGIMPEPAYIYVKDNEEWLCDIDGFVGHGMTKEEALKVATENWEENHYDEDDDQYNDEDRGGTGHGDTSYSDADQGLKKGGHIKKGDTKPSFKHAKGGNISNDNILGMFQVKGQGINTKVEIVGFEKINAETYSLYQPLHGDTTNTEIGSLTIPFSAFGKIRKGNTVSATTKNGDKVKIYRVGPSGSFAKGGHIKKGDTKPSFKHAKGGKVTTSVAIPSTNQPTPKKHVPGSKKKGGKIGKSEPITGTNEPKPKKHIPGSKKSGGRLSAADQITRRILKNKK